MKIVCWNVNGLRSLTKGIDVTLSELDADIVCFQETKINKHTLTETLAIADGYRSYFSFCERKSGYSGVVTYCKREVQPIRAVAKLSAPVSESDDLDFSLPSDVIKSLDCEGRAVITQHQLTNSISSTNILTVINVYCPCITGEINGRDQFRLDFLQMLAEKVASLRRLGPVIVAGDLNIAHTTMDHCDPGDEKLFYDGPHRLWLNNLIGKDGALIDSYRHLHPDKKFAYTCWNTRTGARQTNFGTRIDYILIDKGLLGNLQSANVHSRHMGSDHCPVSVELSLTIGPATVPPKLCSSHHYKQRQQKLTMFIKKRSVQDEDQQDEQSLTKKSRALNGSHNAV